MAVDDRHRLHRHPVQVSAWRGDDRTVVLSPSPDRPLPTVEEVALSLRRLADQGQQRAITSALHHHELEPFLQNGFDTCCATTSSTCPRCDPTRSAGPGGATGLRSWRSTASPSTTSGPSTPGVSTTPSAPLP